MVNWLMREWPEIQSDITYIIGYIYCRACLQETGCDTWIHTTSRSPFVICVICVMEGQRAKYS